MKLIKSHIEPKSSIVINFSFPPPNNSDKEKIYRLNRELNRSDNKSSIYIIIEIIFVIYPIQINFYSEKYSLTFDNQQYKLNTTKLLKGEIIKFKIENHFKQMPFQLQFSITSLEKNTNDEPIIEIKNSNEFNIIIQNNNGKEDIDKLNCLIDIYFSEEKKISILIDSLIISTYFDFYIYDYETKNFVNDKMDIYIPSFENECEIELHFLVSTFIEKKILLDFLIFQKFLKVLLLLNHSNEIKINSYENYFSIKLKFNLSKFYDNEIAVFEFKINDLSKKIQLFQKNQSIKNIDLKLIKKVIKMELKEI